MVSNVNLEFMFCKLISKFCIIINELDWNSQSNWRFEAVNYDKKCISVLKPADLQPDNAWFAQKGCWVDEAILRKTRHSDLFSIHFSTRLGQVFSESRV